MFKLFLDLFKSSIFKLPSGKHSSRIQMISGPPFFKETMYVPIKKCSEIGPGGVVCATLVQLVPGPMYSCMAIGHDREHTVLSGWSVETLGHGCCKEYCGRMLWTAAAWGTSVKVPLKYCR